VLNFVKLAKSVQLQQQILGCGTTGIYLNFTFMKSACHKLNGDIKIVLVLISNPELCFIENHLNLCPISRIVLWGHIQHEITQEVEQM